MKKIILTTLIILSIFSFAKAQDSKGYVGISLGAAFPGGDVTTDFGSKTGLNLSLINAGYRFSDRVGMTFNWGASAYKLSDDQSTFAIGYLAIGPMFSFPISDKFSVDSKPQIAYLGGTINDGTDEVDFNKSLGLIIGSSINYAIANHWELSLNFDYLSTKFNKLGGIEIEDYKSSFFNTSAGIHYRF
jgi:hypothetical protein